MGNVKSLMEGEWSIPDVLTMLEGGNFNLLSYVEGRASLRAGFSMLGSTSIVRSTNGADGAFNTAFDSRYKGKRVASYRKYLNMKVEKSIALHGCDGSKPIRKPAYMSNAVSPNRRSSSKSYSSTSSHTANNIQDLKNVEDGNEDFNMVHDDGIRIYSQPFDNHSKSDVSYDQREGDRKGRRYSQQQSYLPRRLS